MLFATCHCGAVGVEIPGPPQAVTNCNCSICRRLGALWAYYPAGQVRCRATPNQPRPISGATEPCAPCAVPTAVASLIGSR